jgi:hypothetical protein
MYGLHLLMPIEYIIPVANGDEKDSAPMKVLISLITNLEQLQEARMQGIQ